MMPVRKKGPEPVAPPATERARAAVAKATDLRYVRFRPLQCALHACMMVSFITLALTGLSLKFSYTGWAARLSHLVGGFQIAGFIHRCAAILMITTIIVHLADVVHLKRRQGRSWRHFLFGPDTMLFTRQDFSEFFATMKWFVGVGRRPHYGRWTYWEKFDYFAVFWGVFVIGATGLTLWFPIFFTRFLPGSFINVATIIHSDEALLAAGFIFTIHFFNTHLRPEKFPMDTNIFTGQMQLAELKRDKPREYEQLLASRELDQHLTEPQPPIVVKTIKVFASIALATGLFIVVWTIYAMIFAYR